MNIIQLVLKQMRQRALSTWLTLLSVMLGVALATATLIAQRSGDVLFGQSDFGYDLLIGAKGSKLQLVLNTVYHVGQSQGTIPYSYYESLEKGLPRELQGAIEWKVPMTVGDNYEGHRIVGTTTNLFGVDEAGKKLPARHTPEYRAERSFELAEGRVFHPRKFEAVVGTDLLKRGLKLGSKFKAEHGAVKAKMYADEHSEQWTVVGILKPTHTANDGVIFIPLTSFYAIPEHGKGLRDIAELSGHATTAPADHEHENGHEHGHEEAYTLAPDGTIELKTPKDEWRVSAVLAKTPGLDMAVSYAINNGSDTAMAVNPAWEMRQFFNTFLKAGTVVLLAISVLVCVVAAVSILVSIYNSVSARRKEIAILRALGATRAKVLTLICLEAGLIGLVGGAAGMIAGHLIGAAGSVFLKKLLGEGVSWMVFDGTEALYLGAVVVLSVLAGLAPAMKAYKTPVATHLVAA